jgi:hypothetical protein
MSDTILSSIERGMQSLIEGMTQGSGYNYDWGSVNEIDEAKMTFPSAEITLEVENCLDDKEGVWSEAYEQEALYIVRVRAQLSNETERPSYEINTELNLALDDLKKLFGTTYHVSDSCDTIMYVSTTRIPGRNGDIFRPSHMDTRWRVRYTQDRKDPTSTAE